MMATVATDRHHAETGPQDFDIEDSRKPLENAERDMSKMNLEKSENSSSIESTCDTTSALSATSQTDVDGLERKFRYMKFQSHDFTKDDQFQSGWKKLAEIVPQDQTEKQLLKAKLFYYSKHIERIDIDDYLDWKDKLSDKTEKHSALPAKGDNSDSSTVTAPQLSSNEVGLTFSEVMELIQSGRDIPGVKKIDVQPIDSEPSPSVLQRKSKPWES